MSPTSETVPAAEPEPVVPAGIDAVDWPELSYRLDLTDGLPTFPPERRVVDRLVSATGLPADHVVGVVPPVRRVATIEAVAANAAMAGCLPEHMPVVVAALDAMLEPAFNLAGVVTTTHPCWPLAIVSGDAVRTLAMATRESVMNGGGARANAVIGRALRLITWNVGGARPRQPVQEIIGHPGRYAYCIAEEVDDTPWEPFHTVHGVDAPGGVTVFACEGPQIVNFWGSSKDTEGRVSARRLDMVAEHLSTRGNNNTHTMGETLVLVTVATARALGEEGWSRRDVQEYLWQKARRRLGDIKLAPDGSGAVDDASAYAWWPDWVDQHDPDTMVPVTASPERIHVVVSGADSIPCAAVCTGWGNLGGFAVARPLHLSPGPQEVSP